MRQLWCDINSPVAARQHWTVFVQRVWSLSQDQWTKQAADQTEEKIGK
jgi:hypothetical protein